jgi:hypothetical protein
MKKLNDSRGWFLAGSLLIVRLFGSLTSPLRPPFVPAYHRVNDNANAGNKQPAWPGPIAASRLNLSIGRS